MYCSCILQHSFQTLYLAGPISDESVKNVNAAFVRLSKPLLLQANHPQDEVVVLQQLPVDVPEVGQHHLGYLTQEGLVQAQKPPVPYGPPDYPAQHVAPALVARHHAVADQKRRRPGVLRHHPQGVVVLWVHAVGLAR